MVLFKKEERTQGCLRERNPGFLPASGDTAQGFQGK